MFILTILALVFFGGETNEEWSIDYTVTHEGPRVVYSGTVWLHCDENQTAPCINYCFDVPENGRLAGPAISSNPGEAIIPFDNYVYKGKALEIDWCRSIAFATVLPVSIPRHFIFYVMRTEFGPDDVLKLLGDWGLPISPWDLNNDGIVEGQDLAILLGAWKNDKGPP